MKFHLVESIDLDSIPEKNKHGNCYTSAVNYVMKHPDTILVHGIVTGQGAIEGIEYGHAWVEDGDTVIDTASGKELPKFLYYALGNIHYTKRYSYNDMLEKMLETETYGPWDKKILQYP